MKRVKSIYGDTDEQIYGIHHYEAVIVNNNDNIYVVNSDYPGAYSVTNFDYEERVNEEKRRIKIIAKPVLDSVLKQYSQMFI
jgi:hypothetical protein